MAGRGRVSIKLATTRGLRDAERRRPRQMAADLPVPRVEFDAALAHMLEYHTDMLTALNKVTRAQVNLRLQKLTPVPDMSVNVVANTITR